MEQRSEQWFEARKGKVTASVAGAILGLSPTMAREDVMRRMVREYHGAKDERAPNIAMEYGTRNEPMARQEYELETGEEVSDAGFYIDPANDWLGASPDGMLAGNGLLEIKCPFSQRGLDGKPAFKSLFQQQHYYAQMQVQLHVTGRHWGHFYQWAPMGTRLETVTIDDAWRLENIPKLRAFYDEYLRERENPAQYLEDKRRIVDTPAAHRMMAEWDQLTEAEDRAKERKAELLGQMAALAGDRDAIFAGRMLTRVERAGSVSYAKALAKYAPNADLEPFRGKATAFWQVK